MMKSQKTTGLHTALRNNVFLLAIHRIDSPDTLIGTPGHLRLNSFNHVAAVRHIIFGRSKYQGQDKVKFLYLFTFIYGDKI